MNTLSIKILELDSGPSETFHQSPHKETLNDHSLSLNRYGYSPISRIVHSTSKTLDRSSSSMEDTETLDGNHDNCQSLVHFGPQPLSIDGSSAAMGPQENLFDCDAEGEDNDEEIYRDIFGRTRTHSQRSCGLVATSRGRLAGNLYKSGLLEWCRA